MRPSSSFAYPVGQQLGVDTKSSNTGHLFALIIGINIYESPSIQNLLGAVPDADSVRDYLQNDLNVPSSRIRNLRDADATRDAIIGGIKAFSTNDEIKEGDPILIYYAGHGGWANTPKEWSDWYTDKFEFLVPYDHSSLDDDPIHGITDRTVGVLLSQLAIKKGDNITVILDSCHSSSCTRDLSDPTLIARTIDFGIIPSKLDQDIINSESSDGLGRGAKFHPGFARSGLRSHVLLAACHSGETAFERTSRGLFTEALLKTLKLFGIGKLKYNTLLDQMQPLGHGQNPQCEGFNIDRWLFNRKVSDERSTAGSYKIRKSEGETYVMPEAGEAAGITVGAEFDVYQDHNSGHLLGTVVARELSPFSTTLYAKSSRIDLKQDGVARKSHAGTEERVRIHVADGSLKLENLVKKIDPKQRIVQLAERDRAEFGIALENGKVVFIIYDPDVTKYGLTRMPHSVKPTFEALSPVIHAAAHFYWHRRRTPKTGRRGLAKNVGIEVNELEEEMDDEFEYFHKPITTPNGGLKVGKDLNLQIETTYGWTISNKWGKSLYPSLFYFDNSDWSITPHYEPPISGDIVEAPLKGKGQLTVGYGNSGWAPYTFFLREGQNVDVGILKLFLSRQQVNLSHVAQLSPFFASAPERVGGHSTAPPSLPYFPTGGPSSTAASLPFHTSVTGFVGGRSTAPLSLPSVPTEGPSSTTTSLPFDANRASRAQEVAVLPRETNDPRTWRLHWDTIEISVVQRRENV